MNAPTPSRRHAGDANSGSTTAEKQRRSHSYPLNPYAEGSDDESACPLESVSNLSLSPRRGGGGGRFNVSGGNNNKKNGRTDPWLRFRNVFSGKGFCDVGPRYGGGHDVPASPSPLKSPPPDTLKDWQQRSSPSLESIDTEDTSHASHGDGGADSSAYSSPVAAAPPADGDEDIGDCAGTGGPVDEATIADAREAAMAAAAGAMAEAEAWRATMVVEEEDDGESDEGVETETDEDDEGDSDDEDYSDEGEEEGSDDSEGTAEEATKEWQDHKASVTNDSRTSNKEEETDDDSIHGTAVKSGRREASLVAAALAISVGILAVAHRRDGGGGGAVSTATMKAPRLEAPSRQQQQKYPNLDIDVSGGLDGDGTEGDVSMGIPSTLAVDDDDGPEVEEEDLASDSEGDGHEVETEELVAPTQAEHGISSSSGEQDYESENEDAEQVVQDMVALAEESMEETLFLGVHEGNVATADNEGVPVDLQEGDNDDVAEVHDVDVEEEFNVDDYVATDAEAQVEDIKGDAGGSNIALEEGGKQGTQSQQHRDEGPAGQDAEDDLDHVHVANPAFVPIRQRADPTSSPERRWGVKTATGDTLPVEGGDHDLPETDAAEVGEEHDGQKDDVPSETDDTVATMPDASVAISTHTRVDWKGVLRDLVSEATFTMRI